MRCSTKIAAVAALMLPCVSAASIADLPTCALKAASSGIADTGCTTTDYKCLCSASSFTSALQNQVMAECSSSEYQATVDFAKGVCGGVGVTLNLPSANNDAASAAPAAAAPASGQATQAAGSAASSPDDDGEGAAAAPTSSYEAYAAPTSTAAITTTATIPCKKTACANGTYNATVNTSLPVPFEGKAASQRMQWASAALVVGAVGAFVAL